MSLFSLLNESFLNAYNKAHLQAAPFLSNGSSLVLLTTWASGFLPLVPPLPTSEEWLSLLNQPLMSPAQPGYHVPEIIDVKAWELVWIAMLLVPGLGHPLTPLATTS